MKTLEAFIRGYFLFDVNGEKFLFYTSALNHRKSINGNVYFKGFHLFKGWLGFYERFGVQECSVCGTTKNVKYVGGYQPYRCGSVDCIPF